MSVRKSDIKIGQTVILLIRGQEFQGKIRAFAYGRQSVDWSDSKGERHCNSWRCVVRILPDKAPYSRRVLAESARGRRVRVIRHLEDGTTRYIFFTMRQVGGEIITERECWKTGDVVGVVRLKERRFHLAV